MSEIGIENTFSECHVWKSGGGCRREGTSVFFVQSGWSVLQVQH